MSDAITLTQSRIREGVWEGILTGHQGNTPPLLRAHGPDRPLADPQVRQIADDEGSWAVRVDIPRECLNEGVQSFVIEDSENGAMLANFTIVAGPPVEDHIAAEVALLRKELDMVKSALRRLMNQQR